MFVSALFVFSFVFSFFSNLLLLLPQFSGFDLFLFCVVLGFVADVGIGIAFFFFELEIFLANVFLLGNFFRGGGVIDCIVIHDLVWKKLMWGDRM